MDALQWNQASASRYSRALDQVEIFYATVAAGGHPLNREHWTITATANFDFETADLVASVRQAWTVLRYDHPSMASTIIDGKRVYDVVTSEQDLDKWVDETFVVVDDSAAELFPELYRAKQLMLYLMPKNREIMLRCPHERSDGNGMIHLMNNLFELLSSPRAVQFGDEAKNLSPSFVVAANIPEANERQVAKAMKELETFGTALPSIGLPATNTSGLPGKTRRLALSFSREETTAIVLAAKAHEFTVTHVFHAAIILATKSLGKGTQKYANFWLINCRDRCVAPFDSNKHPMAAYHWGGPIVISPTNFADTAVDVKKKYQDTRADEDLLPMLATSLAALTAGLSQPPPAPLSAPILSSIGVLDSKLCAKYGSISVKGFWLGDDMLTPEVETFLWSWQGMIELSGCYNEAFYDAGMVEKYLTVVKEILFDGLGIELR
jgi:hypothetical protein